MDDKHQPKPTECSWSAAVQPVARDNFNKVFKSQWARGKEKYGTDLQSFNGRDACADAMQELADAVAYVTQMGMEIDIMKHVIKDMYDLMCSFTDIPVAYKEFFAPEYIDDVVELKTKAVELLSSVKELLND